MLTGQARIDSMMELSPVDTTILMIKRCGLEYAREQVTRWEHIHQLSHDSNPSFESDRAQCYALLSGESALTDGGNVLIARTESCCV